MRRFLLLFASRNESATLAAAETITLCATYWPNSPCDEIDIST